MPQGLQSLVRPTRKREAYSDLDPPRQPTPLEVDWHEQAACYRLWYENPKNDPFFVNTRSEATRKTAEARQWCLKPCPVREQCLRSSLEHRDRYGVWGGLGPNERRRYLDRIDSGELTLDQVVSDVCGG